MAEKTKKGRFTALAAKRAGSRAPLRTLGLATLLASAAGFNSSFAQEFRPTLIPVPDQAEIAPPRLAPLLPPTPIVPAPIGVPTLNPPLTLLPPGLMQPNVLSPLLAPLPPAPLAGRAAPPPERQVGSGQGPAGGEKESQRQQETTQRTGHEVSS